MHMGLSRAPPQQTPMQAGTGAALVVVAVRRERARVTRVKVDECEMAMRNFIVVVS